uniref:Uncharacterized protein n=1 Tax=Anguilla anguilla TaxID=7936 RepID=A0A0E9RKJ5_ANGAN
MGTLGKGVVWCSQLFPDNWIPDKFCVYLTI